MEEHGILSNSIVLLVSGKYDLSDDKDIPNKIRPRPKMITSTPITT